MRRFLVMAAVLLAFACNCWAGLYDDYIPGDANRDGGVDISDIQYIANHWSESGTPGTVEGDVNQSGLVDISDIQLVAANWLRGLNRDGTDTASSTTSVAGSSGNWTLNKPAKWVPPTHMNTKPWGQTHNPNDSTELSTLPQTDWKSSPCARCRSR